MKAMRSAFSEAWEKTSQPMSLPSTRGRSTSKERRASTRTRAASLEKIERTGSIKTNKSLIDNKSGYTVESRSISRSGSRLVSRPGSRAGSRDRWERSRWTGNEDDTEKGKEGGIHAMREKKVVIAKVRNSITPPARQGKWIPISVFN